ncbi:D-arabinitol 2-dehydrogenase [ribulose-forming] [Leucoagaricus sp. SymC.cos]|nr:D-arabinitol 2-dehydrogenase [ribulose-forming] [Leucoagaricus sp. SymC.cos]
MSRPRTLSSFSLENKVCLVTGAARGLGLEFCHAFVQSGSTALAILDLKETEAKAAAGELVTFARENELDIPTVLGIGCDVSSEAEVQNAYKVVVNQFGRVDVAVACAGITENYPALDYPANRVHLLFDINVHGAFYTAREAAKHMINQGSGSIILVASMSANVGPSLIIYNSCLTFLLCKIVNVPQFQTPYNASKAAVKHMASSLAVEWAKTGVRVNALSPGYMLTKLTRTVLQGKDELKKTWEDLTPMGRMGDPEDLAGAIVFLASDASKFVTGSEVRVDGGYCCV